MATYAWRLGRFALEIVLACFVLSFFLGNDGLSFSVEAATSLPPIAVIQVAGTADLTVSKTDSPDPVVAGNNITYTINFSNAGPDAATTVQVQDNVPAGTTFVAASVTSGSGWSISSPPVGGTGAVTFSKATVANGETAVFSLVVNVNSAATSISNTVTASSATGDPTPANSSSTATTGVTMFDTCIQDDATRAILSVNTTTGTFQFSNCSKGTTFTGVGTVIRDPGMCKIFFSSQSSKGGSGGGADATFNLCTMTGTGQVFVPGSSTPIKLNDTNIKNNTCGCL